MINSNENIALVDLSENEMATIIGGEGDGRPKQVDMLDWCTRMWMLADLLYDIDVDKSMALNGATMK